MEKFDVLPKHMDGIVSQLRVTKGVELAVFLYENEDGNEVVVKAEGATVKQYKQYALALQDLKNGRIDAILMDKIPAELMLK